MNAIKQFFIITLLTLTATNLMAVGRVASIVDTAVDIAVDPLDRDYRGTVLVEEEYPYQYRTSPRRADWDEMARLRAENRRLRAQNR